MTPRQKPDAEKLSEVKTIRVTPTMKRQLRGVPDRRIREAMQGAIEEGRGKG